MRRNTRVIRVGQGAKKRGIAEGKVSDPLARGVGSMELVELLGAPGAAWPGPDAAWVSRGAGRPLQATALRLWTLHDGFWPRLLCSSLFGKSRLEVWKAVWEGLKEVMEGLRMDAAVFRLGGGVSRCGEPGKGCPARPETRGEPERKRKDERRSQEKLLLE